MTASTSSSIGRRSSRFRFSRRQWAEIAAFHRWFQQRSDDLAAEFATAGRAFAHARQASPRPPSAASIDDLDSAEVIGTGGVVVNSASGGRDRSGCSARDGAELEIFPAPHEARS